MAAMAAHRSRDEARAKRHRLANFYQRIRKRSSAKIARVAAARKLAEICWKRLIAWERQHNSEKAVA
jgi:hypothetical protein